MVSIPFFSFVVSAYNRARTVGRTLDSILSQGFGDFEVIVVDDGSTDSTREVVEEYAKRDSRVKLICHPQNQGLSQTRVTGLAHAEGRYIWFVDAGDRIIEDSLKGVARKISEDSDERVKVYLVGSKSRSSISPKDFDYWMPSKSGYHEDCPIESRTLLRKMLDRSPFPLQLYNKIFDAKWLKGLRVTPYDEFYGEDVITNIRIFANDFMVRVIESAAYVWYLDGDSHMSPRRGWEADKRLLLNEWKLLSELGIDTDENLKSLSHGFISALAYHVARERGRRFLVTGPTRRWVMRQMQEAFWKNVACHIDIPDIYEAGDRLFRDHWIAYSLDWLITR